MALRSRMSSWYIFFILSSSIVTNAATSLLDVKCSHDTCEVTFQLEGGNTHKVELIKEETSLFGKDCTISDIAGEITSVHERKVGGIRYHTGKDERFWATALISHDGKELLDGIFSTESHGVLEWEKTLASEGPTYSKRRSLIEVTDLEIELPGAKPRTKHRPEESSNVGGPTASDQFSAAEIASGIIPFYPGCFPKDQVTHVTTINIVFDYGIYQEMTAGFVGSDQAKRDKLLQDLESKFAAGKLLYLSQLNVRVEVNKVIFGKPTDPLPLSRSRADGTCKEAYSTWQEFITYVGDRNPKDSAGYWMLLSNCFGMVNGVSYIGNLCGDANNGGVSAYAWHTMFHELGHGFGASHSWDDTQHYGGLMDYGDSTYKGVTQFHPLKRVEICNFLTNLKSEGRCRHFTEASVASNCGDGVLTKLEECECLEEGSKSCGQCVQCKLTDKSIECSASQFIVRNELHPSILIVEKAALASSECCIKNRFTPPKTLCGTDNLNVCAGNGMCVPLCTTQLLEDTPSCGFDSTGCMLGCVWKARCRYDLTYTTMSGADAFVGQMPDGSPCQLTAGGLGKCQNSKCYALGGTIDIGSTVTTAPTPRPTERATWAPVPAEVQRTTRPTARQTAKPTVAPSGRDDESPSISIAQVDAQCRALRIRRRCVSAGTALGCKWCGRSCIFTSFCTG